ncbi:hypothetical protein [Bellilinea sp.]|uniref:hypothetical protein n=1 Tax=Bellilinea sp. TaxID=2838785 RepID=UPI0021DCC692|nr:hypothetical protein [Bellilinea sp.]GIV64805.1 MAG: hypothetical protein KatS3mg046_065 [Bellilinea sp.]
MPTSSNTDLHQLQERLGCELVAEMVRELPDADLEAALLDEKHPLAAALQRAVRAALDTGQVQARQIVVTVLEAELLKRRGGT